VCQQFAGLITVWVLVLFGSPWWCLFCHSWFCVTLVGCWHYWTVGRISAFSFRPSEGEVMRWAYSLEALLTNQYGVAVFRDFLRSEFSEENLDFWLAVEKFKRTPSLSKMATQARRIYDQFLSPCAARKVNADSTNHSLSLGVNPASFQRAQDQIFSLMEADSYPRFLKSHLYAQLANHNTGTAVELSNQTNQSVID
uniref:RGS domain-containing protein n=1 Tax=Xiphophorus maculatus TaxID=8083 RepID=A0A3B5R9T5_XIPMA